MTTGITMSCLVGHFTALGLRHSERCLHEYLVYGLSRHAVVPNLQDILVIDQSLGISTLAFATQGLTRFLRLADTTESGRQFGLMLRSSGMTGVNIRNSWTGERDR